MSSNSGEKNSPGKKQGIVVPFDLDWYMKTVQHAKLFREKLDWFIQYYPELFPCQIADGYRFKDIRIRKKINVPVRRILIGSTSFTIRPSFVIPYHTALTQDVEKALFLHKFNVPFWALAHVFGKDHMFWYRIEQHLGQFSIVGTTIKDPDFLPEHVAADEKHTRRQGKKVYVPTTVGCQCILGVSVCEDAGTETLTSEYNQFKKEAQNLAPQYSPKSVNTDGWQATMNAWKAIFTDILSFAASCMSSSKSEIDPERSTGNCSRVSLTKFGIATRPKPRLLFLRECAGFSTGRKRRKPRCCSEADKQAQRESFSIFKSL